VARLLRATPFFSGRSPGRKATGRKEKGGGEPMELLKERIRKDGKVKGTDVLKVDSFLNHQMDVELFAELGKEFKRRFADCEINKILTIEASGIGIACVAAQYFHCPVIFAKKSQTKNIAGEVYTSQVESFTHGRVYDIIVAKEFLGPGDKVLLIDDFLANGAALEGLAQLVKDAGAELVGAGIVIEKAFQPGGDRLREKGLRIEALARVQSMNEETGITFADD
jgi:xanthine phosphoribosyltransferase